MPDVHRVISGPMTTALSVGIPRHNAIAFGGWRRSIEDEAHVSEAGAVDSRRRHAR